MFLHLEEDLLRVRRNLDVRLSVGLARDSICIQRDSRDILLSSLAI